jgi:hypothetical protein
MAKKIQRAILANKRKAYLTKRTLVRATDKAAIKLTHDAMRVKGYIVIAEGNWVVKIDNTGKRQRLSRISQVNSREKVVLD